MKILSTCVASANVLSLYDAKRKKDLMITLFNLSANSLLIYWFSASIMEVLCSLSLCSFYNFYIRKGLCSASLATNFLYIKVTIKSSMQCVPFFPTLHHIYFTHPCVYRWHSPYISIWRKMQAEGSFIFYRKVVIREWIKKKKKMLLHLNAYIRICVRLNATQVVTIAYALCFRFQKM